MELTDLVQGELSDAERLTLGALITVDVHARDVVQELVDAGALVVAGYLWSTGHAVFMCHVMCVLQCAA